VSQERIDIVITENGMRRVKANLDDISKGAKAAEGALSLLKSALGGLGITALVRSLINSADAFTNMQNQIRLVTSSQAEMNVVSKELLGIANRTRSDLDATASMYTKVSRQASTLGMTQNQTLQFTESLNQAIVLSGSSSQEASAGIRQLGQAIGSGVLRGDELNSVLENTSEVAMVIAKGMGVTIGSLRALGAQGKISGKDIIDAFTKAREELSERFARTIPTVGQALQVLSNSWQFFVGTTNNASGITAALARGILYLANNLETLARGGGIIAITLLVRVLLPEMMTQLTLLATTNPFGLILTAVTATIAALVMFSDQIKVSDDKMVDLRDVGVAVFNELAKGSRWIGDQFHKAWDFILATGRSMFGDLIDTSLSFPRAVAKSLDTIILGFKVMGNVVAAVWNRVKTAFTEPLTLHDTMGDTVRKAMMDTVKNNGGTGPGHMEQSLGSFMNDARMEANNRLERQMAQDAAESLARKNLDKNPAKDTGRTVEAKHKLDFKDLIHRLREEGQELRLTGVMREAYNNKVAMETKLKRQLTMGERQLVLQVTQDNHALKDRADILEGLDSNSTRFIERQTAINALMAEAPGLTKVLNQELAELEMNMLQAQKGGTFVDGYVRQMRIMQLETRNAMSDMGASMAAIFGPGGTMAQGVGQAVATSIVHFKEYRKQMEDAFRDSDGNLTRHIGFWDVLAQQIKGVAESIIEQVISSLVQMGINMAINAAIGNTLGAAAAAASMAEGAAVAAAWAPAAALVNAATFGAGAAAGTAATATSIGVIKGLSIAGFAEGGYTGNVGRGTIAGVVHGQEGVLNAGAMRRLGTRNLDRMNSGMSYNQPTVNVTAINKNVPGMQFSTRQISETDVQIIAEQVLNDKGPSVIAQDLSRPSGKVSRSLGVHTTATRKRT